MEPFCGCATSFGPAAVELLELLEELAQRMQRIGFRESNRELLRDLMTSRAANEALPRQMILGPRCAVAQAAAWELLIASALEPLVVCRLQRSRSMAPVP